MAVCKKFEFLVGEEWGKEIKRYAVPYVFRASAVYLVYLYKREVFVSLPWWPYLSKQGISGLEAKEFYLRL